MDRPSTKRLSEAALLVLSTLLALAGALALLRWLAPSLLGIPVDLQLVRAGKEVPPFYENVFRITDLTSREFLLPDPLLTRAKPLLGDAGALGPHDLLGFRNRAIPTTAAIIAIGDSQTYGNNAALEQSWPGALARRLGLRETGVYSMATGGWTAIEYLYMADKAHAFRPRAIVVAFYAGNDPIEAFVRAYGNPHWAELRLDPGLTAQDAPNAPFPPQPGELWHATLAGGGTMTFTPSVRYASVQPDPAVDAGWDIMATAAERMASLCQRSGTELFLTLIPTKETAMRRVVEALPSQAPGAYWDLVNAETDRAARFAARLQAFPHGRYVDVIGPLQAAAQTTSDLYPAEADGHPLAAGYEAIAAALAAAMDTRPWRPTPGVYAVGEAPDSIYQYRLVTEEGWWLFRDHLMLLANGWRLAPADGENHDGPADVPRFSDGAELTHLPYLGLIDQADRQRFGP
jgi:hypothetical protein